MKNICKIMTIILVASSFCVAGCEKKEEKSTSIEEVAKNIKEKSADNFDKFKGDVTDKMKASANFAK
jgi:hypothetical protein